MPDIKKKNDLDFLDKKYEFDVQKLMKNSDSYKSLIYGIVTVVVLFVVIALGVRNLAQNRAQIDENAVTSQAPELKNQDTRYTVAEGDTLWSISEKVYNDGFGWKEIADANKISNPSSIEKGMILVIPQKTQGTPTITVTPAPAAAAQVPDAQAVQKITGNSYTVIKGDYLWEIAVRAYGDGYRWVDIAKVNNLDNPDMIFSGNVFKLPRP